MLSLTPRCVNCVHAMALRSATGSLRTVVQCRVTSPLLSYSPAASCLGQNFYSFFLSQADTTHRRRKSRVAHGFSTSSCRATLPSVDDNYKTRTVQELLSLKDKVTVITGGGRGIGLALARGCIEAGGSVAVLDALPAPHADFEELKMDYPDVKVGFYQYVKKDEHC